MEAQPIDSNLLLAQGSGVFLFMSAAAKLPLHEQKLSLVPGTQIILVGECIPAVERYISSRTNKIIREETGLQFRALAALRSHLGVAGGSGHGGRRPGAGGRKRKKKKPEPK